MVKNLVVSGFGAFLSNNDLVLLRVSVFRLERVKLFCPRTVENLTVLGLQRLGSLYTFVGLLIFLIKLVLLLVGTKNIAILMSIFYLIGLVSLLLEGLLLFLNRSSLLLGKRVPLIAPKTVKNLTVLGLQSQGPFNVFQLLLVLLIKLVIVARSLEDITILVFGFYVVRLVFLLFVGLLLLLRVLLVSFPQIFSGPKLILVSYHFIIFRFDNSSGRELSSCVCLIGTQFWLAGTLFHVLIS